MPKPSRQAPLLICPRCRLVHEFETKRCRHCGDVAPLSPKELVLVEGRRRLRRVTPKRRGWRAFDFVFLLLCFVVPLDAERRHAGWMVPALVATLGAWLLFRLLHFALTRYRLSRVEGRRWVEGVPSRRFEGEGEIFSGKALRLKETVDATLRKERVLASALSLRGQDAKRGLRLRLIRAAPFVVEGRDEARVVEGIIDLVGEAEDDTGEAEINGPLAQWSLDPAWLRGAKLCELTLEGRDEVRVKGGKSRREAVEKIARRHKQEGEAVVMEGVLGNPVCVEVLRKVRR